MRKLSVVFVALAIVMAFSVNAMAAQGLFYTEKERLTVAPTKELEVYGSIRVQTYWFDKDAESQSTLFSDDGLNWNMDDGSSRFGVRFKSGKVGANVEIRPRDQNLNSIGGSTNLLRHWYGSYDMGFGTLIIGQTWTPTFNPICNECLLGGGGVLDTYGDMGGSTRKTGLQLHMPVKAINGLIKVAALEPTPTYNPANAIAVGAAPNAIAATGVFSATPVQGAVANWTDVDYTIPALETSIAAAFGPISGMLRGGYNTFKIADITTDRDETINSWLVALDATWSMGPFYVRGEGYVGTNLAAFGKHDPSQTAAMAFIPVLTATATTTTVDDVDHWGWFGVAGFKFNDMISVEAGYGQRSAELETGAFKNKDKKSAFVLFVPISITPAFVITPEILWTDEGDLEINGVKRDRGNQFYGGIYWRIDF
jgi:hypothetical protein